MDRRYKRCAVGGRPATWKKEVAGELFNPLLQPRQVDRRMLIGPRRERGKSGSGLPHSRTLRD